MVNTRLHGAGLHGAGLRIGLAAAAAAALAACGGGEAPAATKTAAPAPGQAATTTAQTTVAPETREFRDWRAVCDNGGRCVAYAGSDAGVWIMIRRDAGPGAAPTITAGHGPAYGYEGPPEAALTIDGRAQPLRQARDVGLSVPPADVMGALSRLAAAREIRLSVMDEGSEIPAAGASAAMLWIDERQGRLGTVDALIRRGDRPAASAPAAPALPRVVAAPAIDQTGLGAGNSPLNGAGRSPALPAPVAALAQARDCREEVGDYLRDAALAARLDARTELWGVPCSAGAYNVSYALFVSGPGGANPRPADLPAPPGARREEVGDDWLTNPVYDPATRMLSHFPRGRGIGDCGVIQSWTWTAQGFALTEEKRMGDCWGMASDRWPTTWRTR